MKNHTSQKTSESSLVSARKNPLFRTGTKSFAHRHERRKIREQLRHPEWALSSED